MPAKKTDFPATGSLTVTRHFDFPAERVFDAWLDPANVGKWLFATAAGQIVRVQIDARVGGRFSIVDRRDGEDVEHCGEYFEIDRPSRLVFSFGVPKYSDVFSRVTITITPESTGCQLTLLHENVLAEYVEPSKAGWAGILNKLESTLSIAGA